MKSLLNKIVCGLVLVVGVAVANPITQADAPAVPSLAERLASPVVVVTQEELKGIMQHIRAQEILIEEQEAYQKKLEDKVRELVKKTNCA